MRSKKIKLYYNEALGLPRIRMVLPNGTALWLPLWKCNVTEWMKSCWSRKAKDQRDAVRLMNKYDKLYGYPKNILVGEM